MKKGIFAILAMLTVFAMLMVSCGGDGGGSSSPTKYKVTFDLDGGKYDGETTIADVNVVKGKTLDAKYFDAEKFEGSEDAKPAFGGWYTVDADGHERRFLSKTKVTEAIDLKVKWAATAFDENTLITISFDKNGGTGDAEPIQVIMDAEIDLNELPKGLTKNGYEFGGWYDRDVKVTDSTKFSDPVTLTAKWWSTTLTSAANDGYVEKLFLENGAYAVFKVVLPEGATWADYTNLTATFKVSEAEINIRKPRGFRLLGVYTQSDFFNPGEGGHFNDWRPADASAPYANKPSGLDQNGTRFLTLDKKIGGDSAAYGLNQHILDNQALDTWAKINTFIDDTVVADTWFTATYDITGTNKHPNFVADVAMPEDTAEGPFYFALGITGGYGKSGQVAAGITQLIKDIKLVPKEDSSASPAEAGGSGFEEPTFVSYLDPVVYSWRGDYDEEVQIPPNP